jgi:hypothetical protein
VVNYHQMSLKEKQAHSLRTAREPSVICPICDTQTTTADLIAHEARCPGRRDPHPGSRWITWREALALGVARATMNQWVNAGFVRVRGELQDRRYLLRDIVVRIAAKRYRRRQFINMNRESP